MENKDFLGFTHPIECTPPLTVIERCFEDNANFLKVSVPGVDSVMVFEKATLLVNKKENCSDGGCGLPFKGTAESPFLNSILLIGKMFYAMEAETGLSNRRTKNTLEIKHNNTTIDGNSYATNNELYDAIMAVVADCDCTCSDEAMPCEVRVTNIESWSEGEDQFIAFYVSQSVGETIYLSALDSESETIGTFDPVELGEMAMIILTNEEMAVLSDGNTLVFTVTNGNTTCTLEIPVISGEPIVVNNEEEVEVELEGYFEENHGVCDSELDIESILFFSSYSPGVEIVDGDLVFQPDESEPESETVGNIGIARVCNGNIDVIIVINVNYEEIVRPEGLRLVFNDIENVPGAITDPTVVAQWNTFFDLPTNGTAFSSVNVYGNEVVLVGGAGITLKENLFENNTDIVFIEDQSGVVIAAANSACYGCTSIATLNLAAMVTAGNYSFYGCTSLTNYDFSSLTTIGAGCFQSCTSVPGWYLPSLITTGSGSYCFAGSTSATTFDFPSATSLGSESFRLCTAATLFNLPLCTSLGNTSGDNNVFYLISGNTITINVPASLQTNDGGNPDADLLVLAANNTATINYIP